MNLKYHIILFIFILTSLSVSGTDRYWVYFTDKGPENGGLAKTYSAALSERAMERRRLRKIDLDMRDQPVNQIYVANLERTGLTIHRKSRWFNAVSVYLNDVPLNQVRALDFVKNVEPVFEFRGQRIPLAKAQNQIEITSTEYGASFNQVDMLGVPQVHELGYHGENVRIALFDTGFLLEHEALQHVNVIDTYDFIQGDDIVENEPDDDPTQHNHGTMVLAVIAGYYPGNIVGPAYASEYVLAKTENVASETHIEEDNWVAAAEWADSLGVDIISSSLGYSEFDSGEGDYTYEDMDGQTTIVTRGANIATQKGIAVFSSAGNEGNKKWRYLVAPSDGFDVIGMGGVLPSGEYWGGSSRGPSADGRVKPDLAAQGSGVYTISPNSEDGYLTGSGTSFSCPLGAGTAALIYNINPELTPQELRNLMISTASQSDDPDNFRGYGIIDLVSIAGILLEGHQVVIRDFQVSANHGYNALSWESKLEIDNNYWSVWRSDENSEESEIIRFSGEQFNLETKAYHFNDFEIKGNSQYDYFLTTTSGSGKSFLRDSATVTSQPAGEFKILNAFPNPFNNSTIISFSINRQAEVQLTVFDINGRKVRTLIENKNAPADYYTAEWNGLNYSGASVSSGTYFVVLKSSDEITAYKILLLR